MSEQKLNQLIINRLTKTQLDNASDLSNEELYLVDNQFTGNKILVTDSDGDIVESNANVSDIPGVINNTNSTSTTDALSANMGREMQIEITNLKARGRFLSVWNSSTGLPDTNPVENPYLYKPGDYYIVGTVAASGANNYRPNGTQFVIGTASTTVETEEVSKNDTYVYDGVNWILQPDSQKTVTFATIAGQPSDNANLATALDSKLEGVQINGTDLTITDKKVNIPKASNSTLGVVQTNGSYGIEISPNGYIATIPAAEATLVAKLNGRNAVVANNIDIAVREGLGNYDTANKGEWTEPYKAHAREVIGATKVTWNFYED